QLASGSSENFVQMLTSAGTTKFKVDSNGAVTSGGLSSAPGASTNGLLIAPTATPTVNQIQVQNSSGSKVFSVLPGGAIRTMAAFSTLAVASISSGGSASYTV